MTDKSRELHTALADAINQDDISLNEIRDATLREMKRREQHNEEMALWSKAVLAFIGTGARPEQAAILADTVLQEYCARIDHFTEGD